MIDLILILLGSLFTGAVFFGFPIGYQLGKRAVYRENAEYLDSWYRSQNAILEAEEMS